MQILKIPSFVDSERSEQSRPREFPGECSTSMRAGTKPERVHLQIEYRPHTTEMKRLREEIVVLFPCESFASILLKM